MVDADDRTGGKVGRSADIDRKIGAEPSGLTIGMSAATASDAARTISDTLVTVYKGKRKRFRTFAQVMIRRFVAYVDGARIQQLADGQIALFARISSSCPVGLQVNYCRSVCV